MPAIVVLHVATAYLVQPHDLGQSIVSRHQISIDQRQRHELHLIVVFLLFNSEFNVSTHKDFIWQIQAFIFGHAVRKVTQLFLQLIQVSIAHNLLECMRGQLAFNKDRIASLEGIKTVVVKVAVA